MLSYNVLRTFFMLLLCSLPATESRHGIFLRETVQFSNNAFTNYSSLYIDPDEQVMYLASRNHLLTVDINSLALLDDYTRQPSRAANAACYRSWKPDEECENFMYVAATLIDDPFDVVVRKRFVLCNTNAHEPYCHVSNEIGDDRTVVQNEYTFPAKPRDVMNNYVSIVSTAPGRDNVELYTAGHVAPDMLSIVKLFGEHKISTSTSSAWLHKPVFVGMHQDDLQVLIFFREAALEAPSSRNDVVYSRVARICKSDNGSSTSGFADDALWTTFVKARLVCKVRTHADSSSGASHTIEYNFLQDVHYDPNTQQFNAVFLSKDPRVWGDYKRNLDSALCTFNMADIATTLSGNFMHQDSDLRWRRLHDRPAACEPGSYRSASRLEKQQIERNMGEKHEAEEAEENEDVVEVEAETAAQTQVQLSIGNVNDAPEEVENNYIDYKDSENELAVALNHNVSVTSEVAALQRRKRDADWDSKVRILLDSVLASRHVVSLPSTFVEQVVTNSMVDTERKSNFTTITYLLDSASQLHTIVGDVVVHSQRLTLTPHNSTDSRRLPAGRFREMQIVSTNHVHDHDAGASAGYLVMINNDKVIRVNVSACERLRTEHQCVQTLDAQCVWHARASMCGARLLGDRDRDATASSHAPRLYATTTSASVPSPSDVPITKRALSSLHTQTFVSSCQHSLAYLSVSHTVTCRARLETQSQYSCQVASNVSYYQRQPQPTHPPSASEAVQRSKPHVSTVRHMCFKLREPELQPYADQVASKSEQAEAEAESSVIAWLRVVVRSPIPPIVACIGLLIGGVAGTAFQVHVRTNSKLVQAQPCCGRPKRKPVRRPAAELCTDSAKRPRLASTPQLSRYANPQTYQHSLRRGKLESLDLDAQVACHSHLSTQCSVQATTTVIIHSPTARTEAL